MPNVGSAGVFGKNAGTWKAAEDVQGRNAGAWALAQEVWARQAGTWQKVWERNAPPGPVTGLSVEYAGAGTGWNATATWTLPADTDLAAVRIRWTINGTAGIWQSLPANYYYDTQAVASGATVLVEVYVEDTGGLTSSTTSHSAPYAPLHAPVATATRVGLDRVQVEWTHPAGGNRANYTVALTQGSTTTWTDSSTTTSRTMTVEPGVAWSVTVAAVDTLARTGRTDSVSGTYTVTTPGTPTVGAWSYTSITLNWSASNYADNGYEVWRAVGAGAFSLVSTVAGTTYTGAVSQDTNYRYKVRAKGTTYFSAYSGEVRPAIGHASYVATEAYSGTNSSVNLYGNSSGTGSTVGAGGVTVPSNATVTQMAVNLACTFSTSLFCQWSNRDAYYVSKGVVGSKVAQKLNPWQETFAFSQSGSGLAGILLVGSGWSWTSTGGYRATGSITVSGTQQVTYPAVTNSYW